MNPLCPRPGILKISPYQPGSSKVEGLEKVAKLSSNESPLGPSPKAVEAFHRAAETLGRYPDGGATALRQAIGGHHHLDPDRIVCSNGSEQLLDYLIRAYAEPGDEVLFNEYAFIVYLIATLAAGATPVRAPESDFRADVDALLERVSGHTRIVCLANPNNPTGTYLSIAEVSRLRAGLPDHVLLILDAAYAEYIARDDYDPGAALVDGSGANVVMTRTFSKIYGLAGLRVGWAYCPVEVAQVLHRVRQAFNVSTAAQLAATAALDDRDHTARAKAHNDRWLAWLSEEITRLGLKVSPSLGNFILIHFAGGTDQAAGAYEFLRQRGLILRPVAGYGLAQCLRLSVGLEDENRAVVKALAAFLDG